MEAEKIRCCLCPESLECSDRGRFGCRRNAAQKPFGHPDNGRFLVAEQHWIVRVQGVHRYFRRGSERLDVLKDLTLNVPEGDFLGLMGPSGSGKTTLLNLIAGLDKPSEGQVWVGDERISSMTESQLARWRTRHVGFIFQFYHLMPVLTAYENVELPLLLLPLSARQRRDQVLTALDLVGLSDRIRHRPGQLSGGQQQRVGIARAIVTDPTLIVADEPTGDLDARSADEILDLLDELRRSLHKTILLVTHDPRAAQRADRVLHLEKGQLVEQPEVLHEAAGARS
ncbi:MAG: ABC transporter ATP-binding protein [Candidatus Anammoximicrobium sp.]|nr:ABC transporter ATP-binding protein [Candidatus Anammoximicrobium sp.]